MFVKNDNGRLIFIKSKDINVFPCGRRRSNLIDADDDSSTVSDRYYIPFDPEARLNTEANNRKHSGLNGFKQSYLESWTPDGLLSLVLEGYLFKITLDFKYSTEAAFGAALEELLSTADSSTIDSIYANIKLDKVKFFEGSKTVPAADTEVLRDQTQTDIPATCLDFLIEGEDKSKSENYYFSGLSFSASPVDDMHSIKLLTKVDSVWCIHEPARLPKIDHGDIADSVSVGIIQAKSANVTGNIETMGMLSAAAVKLKDANNEDSFAVTLKVKENNGAYQLQFFTPKA